MLKISLAASANETIRLIVSPQQYLRLVSDMEQYTVMFNTDQDYDCFRVSISRSDTGLYCLAFPSAAEYDNVLFIWNRSLEITKEMCEQK